ncbi:hypothetical protein A0J57_20140 [Sphingobium sp. 22B]|uniref:hypothetical protein n=1 Tax=unclassified Sphingobium TaxID=2611147 RepID=UPI000781219D|nr:MULTISPECIES: hypothetical protein [unclassified Sphingobium]KXU30656.1 hypothetical protein AXW74_16725 [Sphingobium sp. AM]KYC30550.1 hypothetical protein A0J57_20140 [Sphingobium sp. 22B]OAP30270.1 hypothetical protein A8O16_19445 [Sphingobium sp. 20006FA]
MLAKMRLNFRSAFVALTAFGAVSVGLLPHTSDAQPNRVYQGRIMYPDFNGRDRQYAMFRTRIVNEMRTGPNFAGHYAMVEIGCGTSCRFALVADVATGKVSRFPYGGEEYYMLWLTYNVKSHYIEAQWQQGEKCVKDTLKWNGVRFVSTNKRVVGDASTCDL